MAAIGKEYLILLGDWDVCGRSADINQSIIESLSVLYLPPPTPTSFFRISDSLSGFYEGD